MSKVSVFIDEFGNSHLDLSKGGTFSHFVLTAVVVRDEELEGLEAKRAQLSRKHFQGSHIKSSSPALGKDRGFEKRLEMLRSLLEIDFVVFSLVIDKSKLTSQNLKEKQVFLKFFTGLFTSRVSQTYEAFDIYFDRTGGGEFQRMLSEYILKKAIGRDLFHQDRTFTISEDTKEQPLIQLADFIGGCIGKTYCTSHMSPRAGELFDLYKERAFISFFPYGKRDYFEGVIPDGSNVSELDQELKKISLDVANVALDSLKPKLSEEQRVILQHLLLVFRTFPDRLIETRELVDKVNRTNKAYTTKKELREDIQKLRDAGVLVASIQGKSGYKLPNKLEDLIGFYNRYLGVIAPMLNRVRIANETIQTRSVNRIKVLDEEQYGLSVLKELIGIVQKRK